MFLDHRPRPVRRLKWRLRLMGVGAVLALLGIFLQIEPLVWAAMAVLLAGVLVRFIPGGERESRSGDDDGQG